MTEPFFSCYFPFQLLFLSLLSLHQISSFRILQLFSNLVQFLTQPLLHLSLFSTILLILLLGSFNRPHLKSAANKPTAIKMAESGTILQQNPSRLHLCGRLCCYICSACDVFINISLFFVVVVVFEVCSFVLLLKWTMILVSPGHLFQTLQTFFVCIVVDFIAFFVPIASLVIVLYFLFCYCSHSHCVTSR